MFFRIEFCSIQEETFESSIEPWRRRGGGQTVEIPSLIVNITFQFAVRFATELLALFGQLQY